MADRIRAATRVILRNQRRKAMRQGDSKKAAAIGVALRDGKVFNKLLKQSREASSARQIRNEEGQIVNVSQWLGEGEFLEWFLDNFDKILEIILKLI